MGEEAGKKVRRQASLKSERNIRRQGDKETGRLGDNEDKYQEPNSKNQDTRGQGESETRFAEEFNDLKTNDSMTFSETI